MFPPKEMDKIVEACSKANLAKSQAKAEYLKKVNKRRPPEHYEDEESCREAGYYWYDEACHAEPKPEEPVEGVEPDEPVGPPEDTEPEEGEPEPESSEEERPAPDECGTKEKCLQYGYQWDPETGCTYPEETPSQQPEE